MPAMQNLYRQLAGKGFTLLAVSVDEEAEKVAPFRDRLQLDFPILLDATQEVAGLYQTYRFPESFLVDRDGVIVERYIGEKPWDSEAYVERVERLLTAPWAP